MGRPQKPVRGGGRCIFSRLGSRACLRPAFCTFGLAECAVPDVWDGGALDLGAGEVDPDAAGRALDHRLASVRLFAVARHIAVVLWNS